MFLPLAHQIWKTHLKPGDLAIDATCGNGYDTEALAKLNLGHLFVFDIQEAALKATQNRVGKIKNISYYLECHSLFSPIQEPVALIVYNLGYLPGGDKSLTTKVQTTLLSFEKGLKLLQPGGLLSCMLYPGHPEGLKEKSTLLGWAAALDPKKFQVSHHEALNRSRAPSLLLIQKIT
ncbi:MAG: rRNA methyltransferase [Chlamydiia bacterium]|nr:rRNA methyltransferase [Chlamydiia bacterium]